MSDFTAIRDIKATRKKQVCEQCGQAIEIGSPALYTFGIYDTCAYSEHCHVECHAAAVEYAVLNDAWDEDFPWFQHMENSEHDHHGWLLQKHPIVAARLNIAPEEVEA